METFLRDFISAIEDHSGAFQIAKLHSFRASNRGMRRASSRLFSTRLKSDDYAFHSGGRDELQFNIGIETLPTGERTIRAGVAFSFQPSRSFPDVGALVPKVARFNAMLRDDPEQFAKLSMWHWQGGERHGDYDPQPIPPGLVKEGTFIFLGHHWPLGEAHPLEALRTFDRLFPLYKYVETASSSTPAEGPNTATLRLDHGRELGPLEWVQASTRERVLDIFLRHREMQRRLKMQLLAEGWEDVVLEAGLGQHSIDVVAVNPTEMVFYEVKSGATVRACLRQAVGQLLEYSLWPGATRPQRIVVVGEPPLDAAAQRYIDALNEAFPLPLEYRQVTLD